LGSFGNIKSMFDKMSKPKDVSIAQQKEEDKENQ
jgi:hypothetical protein